MTNSEKYKICIEHTPADQVMDRFSFTYEGTVRNASMMKPEYVLHPEKKGSICKCIVDFSSQDDIEIPAEDKEKIAVAARLESYFLYKNTKEEIRPFYRECSDQQIELFLFAKKYLAAHTPEVLHEQDEQNTLIRGIGRRNIFSNRDGVYVEIHEIAPTGSILIQGFVGMHKDIYKYVESKKEIKETLDVLINQALERTHHKCCEPKSIEEVDAMPLKTMDLDELEEEHDL